MLLAIVLAAIVVSQSGAIRRAIFPPEHPPPTATATSEGVAQVALTILPGDVQRIQHAAVRWREGMTVGDLLNDVPRVNVVQQGFGESAFISELNGVANEGAGGRNWMYSVNGQRADRSFGVYELRPHDHVLWVLVGSD